MHEELVEAKSELYKLESQAARMVKKERAEQIERDNITLRTELQETRAAL